MRSEDINAYLKEATGGDFSAKDFRTWNATALAAVALAVSGESVATKTARKRAIRRAIEEVAAYLGNTPAVCRASYIDPRVFDAFDGGLTIRPALERVAAQVEPGELPDPPAGARGGGARPHRRAGAVSGAGAASPPERAAAACDGPAVMPWTTIETSTAAMHVQTTSSLLVRRRARRCSTISAM